MTPPTKHDLTSVPATDPTLLYHYRDALYAADMLIAGLHLDLFSWLAARPSSVAVICDTFRLAHRPADVMLTLFTAMGLLEQRAGIFAVTDAAREHLVKGSPWFLGPYYPPIDERPAARELLQVLHTGRPASWSGGKDGKDWHTSMESEDFAVAFTAAMDSRGVYLGQSVANAVNLDRHRHVLDIGGGSGVYACALVARFPHLRATVLDKPPVDRIAAAAIETRGLSARVAVVASDMLTAPIPAIDDVDVHLFSNVLHDWDEPVVKTLLGKSFAALTRGGIVIVHGAHLNREKTGPLHVAEYSVMLMHASEGRCYSIGEIERYLADAGFSDFTFAPVGAARSIITGRKL